MNTILFSLLLSGIVTFVGQSFLHTVYSNPIPHWDVIHYWIPYPVSPTKPYLRFIQTLKIICAIWPWVLVSIVLWMFPDQHDYFSTRLMFLILLRTICYSVTRLHPPNFAEAMTRSRLQNLCFGGVGDLLFSGHTAISLYSYLFLDARLEWNWIGRTCWICLFVLYSVCIVWLRQHYTIDILVAILAVFACIHFDSAWKRN